MRRRGTLRAEQGPDLRARQEYLAQRRPHPDQGCAQIHHHQLRDVGLAREVGARLKR